ncbi:ribosome silencing factor [Fangia hongkongensis]|uniref:ribosome silencing factor n=1 Tax=Fangia hongkongensis TaxID=270495 RepID=UPI0003771BA4|nr:ribosome silencing factor [Fangia hongkongensis]MBK2125794.1 ribosome silencing factor [Fangia hongkongensis]
METQTILDSTIDALESIKAEDISVMNVEHLTEMMSYVVVCTATSVTHAKALANNLQQEIKAKNIPILGVEGQSKSDWVLVDLGDIIVHIMLKETRDFYQLEKLWDLKPSTQQD